MSDLQLPPTSLPVLGTLECPNCDAVVPDARYCGACGAHLVHTGSKSSGRLHSFAAFPDEPVFRLSVVSSLFPQLSHRAKMPFRVAFAVIVALLVIFALAGTSGPLIAVSALSVPLLFFLYIWEVDPYEGSFLLPTALCLVIGAGLGAGWALIGGEAVDRALLPAFSPSLTNSRSLLAAVLVPVVAVLLMCIPMVVARLAHRGGPTESLDGFVAGATGALGFTLAATIDLMAPWLSDGQLTHQSFVSNITQVLLRGISLPLVSALSTGLIGATWWSHSGTRRTAAGNRWLSNPAPAVVLALLVQIGLGFTDLAALSSDEVLAVHLVALGGLVLATRMTIHYVLLHEAMEVTVGPPRVCAHCMHLVPTMPFCPQCGVAGRAVARALRITDLVAPGIDITTLLEG